MRIYLKTLGVCYLIAFTLHVLDILGLRLNFAEMSTAWKTWIIYLTIADGVAAYGLIRNRFFGEILFLLIAFSQLIAYTAFAHIFAPEILLITFHLTTIAIYIFLLWTEKRASVEK